MSLSHKYKDKIAIKNQSIMTRTITCKEAEKDCTWSFDEESMTEIMSKIKEHILAQHKKIEWNPENIVIIKSQIKTKIFKDGVQVESGRFWWWGEKMEKVNKLIADKKRVKPKVKRERLGFKKGGLM
jgi:predicted small metal-binding protein